MTALTVQGLSWQYRGRPILRDISFTVHRGSLTAILGRNGSGKSTLLRCLAGLVPLPRGAVWVDGQDLSQLSIPRRARLLGYLPQFHAPVFPFSVREVVVTGRAAGIRLTPTAADYQAAQEALQWVGIAQLADRPYTELSGGERQLVLIARIVAQAPPIILLDEPLAHLDLGNQVHLLHLLQNLAGQGTTIVAVLHDPTLALSYGSHHLFLKDGRIQWLPEEARRHGAFLSDIYGTPLRLLPDGERTVVLPA